MGSALGEHVLGWPRTAVFRSIQFNAVVESNAAAVHLWRPLGFEVLTPSRKCSTTGCMGTSACT